MPRFDTTELEKIFKAIANEMKIELSCHKGHFVTCTRTRWTWIAYVVLCVRSVNYIILFAWAATRGSFFSLPVYKVKRLKWFLSQSYLHNCIKCEKWRMCSGTNILLQSEEINQISSTKLHSPTMVSAQIAITFKTLLWVTLDIAD